MADLFFHLRRRLLGSPLLKKKKITNFTAFNFFSVWFFLMVIYLPHGVKKAKGRTESHLLLYKSRPIQKWGSWSSKKKKKNTQKEKSTLKQTEGNILQLLWSILLPIQHCLVRIKTFNVMFFMLLPSFKKTEENSNPGHFALAVTDKLQMRRRGKVHGSF